MSRLVAINPTCDKDQIIDHFDGTPEEFAEKYSAFYFDYCQFFKVSDHFDCDGDCKFYWYRTAEQKRDGSYDDYVYLGCQPIFVLMFDDGTCITKTTDDRETDFHSYGEFDDEENWEDYHPYGCYEELIRFFKELAENNGEYNVNNNANVILDEDEDFVV